MSYKIETNVPIPTSKRNKYPWRALEIGDSFFVPDRPNTTMSGVCTAMGRVLGKRFISRPEGTGARVWRVS